MNWFRCLATTAVAIASKCSDGVEHVPAQFRIGLEVLIFVPKTGTENFPLMVREFYWQMPCECTILRDGHHNSSFN